MKGAKVYIAGRNKDKGEKAIAQLKQETNGKEALFLELDLANLKSVQNAAAEFVRWAIIHQHANQRMPG